MQIYLFLQKTHVFSFSDLLKMFFKLFCIFLFLIFSPGYLSLFSCVLLKTSSSLGWMSVGAGKQHWHWHTVDWLLTDRWLTVDWLLNGAVWSFFFICQTLNFTVQTSSCVSSLLKHRPRCINAPWQRWRPSTDVCSTWHFSGIPDQTSVPPFCSTTGCSCLFFICLCLDRVPPWNVHRLDPHLTRHLRTKRTSACRRLRGWRRTRPVCSASLLSYVCHLEH